MSKQYGNVAELAHDLTEVEREALARKLLNPSFSSWDADKHLLREGLLTPQIGPDYEVPEVSISALGMRVLDLLTMPRRKASPGF